jgi:hypothetical protein
MQNVVDILDKLFSYYKVTNVAELSIKIETSQATISSWKTRNSINAIKKKCRELGIFEDIFQNDTQNISYNELVEEELERMYRILLDDTKYRLKDKLKEYTDGSFFDWANKLVPKKYLQKILKILADDKDKYNIENSKDILIERLRGLEVSIINKKNQELISDFIEKRLSKIECYVLIQKHEEIMDYKGFWI